MTADLVAELRGIIAAKPPHVTVLADNAEVYPIRGALLIEVADRLAAAELHLFSGHGCDCRHMADQRAAYLSEQSANSAQMLIKEGTKAYSSKPVPMLCTNCGEPAPTGPTTTNERAHCPKCGESSWAGTADLNYEPPVETPPMPAPTPQTHPYNRTDLNSAKQEGE